MFYATFGIFARQVSDNFGAFSQNYFRCLIVLTFLLIYFVIKKVRWKKINPADYRWVLVWGISGSLVVVLLYIAFNNIALGTTYFLFYSTMIITGLICGKILFNEKLTINKYTSLVLVIIGLILIYSVEFSVNKIVYVMTALLAGLLIGIWNTFSKKVSSSYSVIQMLLIGTSFALVIGLIGAILFNEGFPVMNDFTSWFWMFGFAIAELSATLLVILGFKYLEAQKASLLMPVEVVYATILGFLVYNESLPLVTLIGGLLILLGAILPNIRVRAKGTE